VFYKRFKNKIMHKSSMLRMKWFFDNYVSSIKKSNIKILDVGSYDVNGSYREFFNDKKFEYIGMDMEAGPNVDLVMDNPYNWSEIETDTFDIVISGQTFEHIEFFWITLAEMTRVLSKDGLLCIIVPNNLSEHRHPVDCYRFFTDGMVALARYVCLEPLHAHTDCAPPLSYAGWFNKTDADSVLIAQKMYSGETQFIKSESYKCVPPDQEILRTDLIRYEMVNKRAKYFFQTQINTYIFKISKRFSREFWDRRQSKLLGRIILSLFFKNH
jgi:SAM-dependent methyltransferase